jgi:hypothetical protein
MLELPLADCEPWDWATFERQVLVLSPAALVPRMTWPGRNPGTLTPSCKMTADQSLGLGFGPLFCFLLCANTQHIVTLLYVGE